MNEENLVNTIIETGEFYKHIQLRDAKSVWQQYKDSKHHHGKMTFEVFAKELDALGLIFESFPKRISLKLNRGEAVRIKYGSYVIRRGNNGNNALIPLHDITTPPKRQNNRDLVFAWRNDVKINPDDTLLKLPRTVDIYLKNPSGELAVGIYQGRKKPNFMPPDNVEVSYRVEKVNSAPNTMDLGGFKKPKAGQIECTVHQGALTIEPMVKLVVTAESVQDLRKHSKRAEKVDKLKLYSPHFAIIHLGAKRTGKVRMFSPEFDRDLSDLIHVEYEKRIGNKPVFQHTLMQQTASALRELHKMRFAHQDIKPRNFLVKEGRFHPKIVLCDFDDVTEEKATTTHCGTRNYRSPEKIETINNRINKKTYDLFAADIFALGVTFYMIKFEDRPYHYLYDEESSICLGQKYFYENIWLTLNKSDNNVYQLISEMLHKDPKKRPCINDVCKRLHIISTSFFKKRKISSELSLQDDEEKNMVQNDSDLREQSSSESTNLQQKQTKLKKAKFLDGLENNCQLSTNHSNFFKCNENIDGTNQQPRTEQQQAHTATR